MASMELTDEDKLDLSLPPAISDQPDYPYGLCICLTHRELEKLGLEADCGVGDEIEFVACARVKGVNRTETAMGPEDRVELQITDIEVIECESTEDE